MRPLRVLHVTPYSAGAWAYGGIPRVAHALTSGLAAEGHAVTVCTTDAGDATARLNGAPRAWRPKQLMVDGCETQVFPNLSNRLAYHAQMFLPLGLGRFLADHRGEFDIAHLHACRNVPGAIAGRHLRAAGVPYVLAPNGTAPNIERRHTAKRIFDLIAGHELMRGAARVIAVSDAERRQLLALGVDHGRIRVVPNPIDFSQLTPRLEKPARAANASPLIAYLGKITPRKRVDTLIRAFAHLRTAHAEFANARLVIAGNDMGAGREARRLAAAWRVESCTDFPGLLRGRARLDLLASADVVAYASEDEVFGLVPLESILCGTPVVVADDSGCGEIIERIGGGLCVPPGDVPALARALADLVSGTADLSIATAQERVEAQFSHRVVCRQLVDVYHDVIDTALAQGRSARHMSIDGPTKVGPHVAAGSAPPSAGQSTPLKTLAIIPAHNEAANLPRVVADLRAHCPYAAILVVDDGSSDGTRDVLTTLGVRWLAWRERRGIGAAIRAGLRYASRAGFDVVVRVDADGQHGADEIDEVIRPIYDAQADVVLGCRRATPRSRQRGGVAFIKWLLDQCLSAITRRRVTDATSGFCALGPQAIHVLAEHHPTGYPEPELRLFLSRNDLRVTEVPVQARTRLSGRTSLTPGRVATAAARVLLAMIIVPLRPTVLPPGD
jgi:glycosyltransferase involved in cell wall biosynthesis